MIKQKQACNEVCRSEILQILLIPSKLDLTVIDRWVVLRKISSALVCEIRSNFWLFTSRIWNPNKHRDEWNFHKLMQAFGRINHNFSELQPIQVKSFRNLNPELGKIQLCNQTTMPNQWQQKKYISLRSFWKYSQIRLMLKFLTFPH